jgi:hypothetical protein
MDIHKPKPWHGWREFVKEIGTIVIGVLIALGAEAVVEKLHERRLSDEAREAVRAEIALDLANVQRRSQWQPCLDARLAELTDLIGKAGRGEPFAPPLTVGNPGAPLVHTERWEAATAGGRTSLLGIDEQRAYGRLYTSFAAIYRQELEETQAWVDLMALRDVARPSPELLARAQAALAQARFRNWEIRSSLRQALVFADRVEVRPAARELVVGSEQLADRELLCMPISTPRDEALKRVRDPLGGY